MLHVNFLTLLRALEVNIDSRHVNHIRYYYYYYTIYCFCEYNGLILLELYSPCVYNVLLYNRPVFSDTILQEPSVDRTFISNFHSYYIMHIMLTFIEFDGSQYSNK